MMNPRICTVKHEPPHSYGDCIRACIATILDRDDVPHVFDNRIIKDGKVDQDLVILAWIELRAWLRTYKKTIALFPSDDHAESMRMNNEGIPYILLCGTFRGDHCVICQDGNLIHDPGWYRSEITGPLSAGYYIIGIVGDLP